MGAMQREALAHRCSSVFIFENIAAFEPATRGASSAAK
jgi:hypothetical protein